MLGTLLVVAIAGAGGTALAVCGDVVVDAGETCDDGNTADGDCCSATCVASAAGVACDLDANLCTADACDGAGLCVAGGCSPCCLGLDCTPAPQLGCRQPVPAKSRVTVTLGATPAKNAFKWKFARGPATSLAEFGTPLTTTSYSMCVYRPDEFTPGQERILLAATIPAGGTCGTEPCWQQQTAAFKYRSPDKTPAGLWKALLRSGGDGGTKIVIRGNGANLQLLPLFTSMGTLPVTSQLRSSDGLCWQTQHETAKTNTATSFAGTKGSPSGAFLD